MVYMKVNGHVKKSQRKIDCLEVLKDVRHQSGFKKVGYLNSGLSYAMWLEKCAVAVSTEQC